MSDRGAILRVHFLEPIIFEYTGGLSGTPEYVSFKNVKCLRLYSMN